MYSTGLGVNQDYIKAYTWWKIAASGGDKVAGRNLALITKNMVPNQLVKAKKLAADFLTRKKKFF